jgi:hypothetical protein
MEQPPISTNQMNAETITEFIGVVMATGSCIILSNSSETVEIKKWAGIEFLVNELLIGDIISVKSAIF